MDARPPRCAHFLFIVLLVCLGLLAASAEGWGSSASAPQHDRKDHGRRMVPKKKTAPISSTASAILPAIVRNFRVLTGPEKTRLVIDLDRPTKIVERRGADPSRVIIAIRNAAMSTSAQAKTEDGTVPPPFRIVQNDTPSVVVSWPRSGFRTYKQFTLSNPPRLVVDVTPPIEPTDLPIVAAPAAGGPVGVPLIQPSAPPAKGYTTIVIDPGHGGKDPGARGLRHTEEKDITLKVGLQLRDLLSKQPGVRVLMTREHDVFVELEERAKFANSHGADLFVSIHVNSHPSRAVKGIEIYHFGEAKDQRALEVAARENGTPLSSTGVGWEYLVADLLTTKKIESSLELAWTAKEAMVARMNGHYVLDDHGVKTAPFYVLRYTSMPSILAEIAYISNPAEETLLRKPAFVRDVAESLLHGVLAFLKNSATLR